MSRDPTQLLNQELLEKEKHLTIDSDYLTPLPKEVSLLLNYEPV